MHRVSECWVWIKHKFSSNFPLIASVLMERGTPEGQVTWAVAVAEVNPYGKSGGAS
jgi:hypothetical protein